MRLLPRPRFATRHLAALSLLGLGAFASEPIFFRSDHGVASGAGPLPASLGDPGALRWRVSVDPGHSTPIIVSNQIFLTTFNREAKVLSTEARDLKTGALLWRRSVRPDQIEALHDIGSPATPTPAWDGERLFAFFGSYGLLCYSPDGKLLWEHRTGPYQDEYGAGSSPIILNGRVILNQDHDLDSFLAAFDCATGKLVWRTPRPDAVRSYSTPTIWKRDGREEVIVAGALKLSSYDPANGEELWVHHGLARIVIPTPIPAGERIYVASWAPGGDSGRRITLGPWQGAAQRWDANNDGKLARDEVRDPEVLDRFFRMDLDQDGALIEEEWERHAAVFQQAQNCVFALKPTGRGIIPADATLWKYNRGVPYVSSPVLAAGLLWMVKDGGIVTKIDADTGEVLQEERLPALGRYFASPVAADGKVYFASEQGVVSVLSAERQWELRGSHAFGEKIYSTPVPHREQLLLRTEKALYCFEEPGSG